MTRITTIVAAISLSGFVVADDKGSACEDPLTTKAQVAPSLDNRFFHQSKYSLPWWILQDEGGNLEDTVDGTIDEDDLRHIEETSNCRSSHQGDHLMAFAEAVQMEGGVILRLSGGMPACCSSLEVRLQSDGAFQCYFDAAYPMQVKGLKWRVTKKELKIQSNAGRQGERLRGWLSVTFEETQAEGNKPESHTIEGFFKPFVRHEGASKPE